MRLRVILFFLFLGPAAFAQYPNNWVSYNQQYYKISVAATGIYRLTYDQLQQAGVPVNTIDPRLIQVFHRGEEQAIYFKHDQSPADNKFDNGEYLEFYGQRNDGTMDSRLYLPASSQPHKFYNLYSDTSAYFLTVNPLPVQGKRMEVFDEVNPGGSIAKETWQTGEQLRVFTSEYSSGQVTDKVVVQSFFDHGEGWTGETICTVNGNCVEQRDYVIDQLTNLVTSQSPPTLEIQLTGRDAIHHQAEIYVGPTTGSLHLLTTKLFENFETPVINQALQWSDIGADGKMIVRVKGIGVGGVRERLSVAYIDVKFAQGFDIASATSTYFTLNASGPKSYIEIENAPAATRVWDITDLSNIVQVGTRAPGSLLTAVVANTLQSRKLYVASTFITPAVSQVKPVRFRQLNVNGEFIIVTHRSLKQPALDYADPIKAFADYRASEIGGGYDTLTVTVDELYDQFNYGETSPTAIYEFMRYIIGVGQPQYLFLVGKGRDVAAAPYRRVPGPTELKDLVPVAGSPGSDMLFTAGMNGEPFVAAVATGRLTANNSLQVARYLNKVKEAEAALYNETWRKKILHLSGGIQPSELTLFRGYMEGFADIARGEYLGGSVATLGKHGTAQIEFINVTDQLNSGVDLVTFFGHSAPNTTDVDIGFASDPKLGYNNKGKYPVILVNGCNAGEYFNDGESFGENWVMTADKGARNFIANSSFGFELALREYTNYFYKIGFADSAFLARGIGDVQREVAHRYLTDLGTSSPTFTAQVLQMVLLGDPSMRLFAPTKPDFQTSDLSINVISYDGKPLHALTDSLQVEIVTTNFGRATKRPLTVRIMHTIDDVVHEHTMDFASVLFQDTLKFPIHRESGNFYGSNKIEVFLDPDNKIEELNEDNNTGQWTRFIQFNGTQNLQPANYSIVKTTDVDAFFQDTDVLSGQKTYDVQIDTARSFNSSFLQSKTISGKVLVKVHFDLLDQDSTVYYWRSKPSDKPADQWETTSFTYINNGPSGWTQIAFDQLIDNALNGLAADETNRRFDFQETNVSVSVKTFGVDDATPGLTPSFIVNNAEYYYSPQTFTCRNNTINLVAFDRSTVVPYLGIPFTFQNSGGRSCGREPQLINSFMPGETETGNNDDLIQYIDNLKPADSVILFSVGDAGFASWSSAVKAKLGEIGVRDTDIDTFVPGEPIIIFGKKGIAPGTARIIRSDQSNPLEQELQVSDELTGFVSSGSMMSASIGPALAWHSMSPRFQLPDASDMATVDVYRVGKDGKESLIFLDQETSVDLSGIDASEYPYLKLNFRTADDENLTPAKLKHWFVTFDPAPDGLLVPANVIEPVTLPEGAVHTTDLAFVNISNVDFADSLASVYSITNRGSQIKETRTFNIKGPAAGDTTRFSQTISTLGKVGTNDLAVAVNTGFVTEQYYQNNSIELSSYLEVVKDQRNPVLEVTIDGRFVSNGDFVSANPVIKITLRDENQLIALKDTTTLDLWMAKCSDDKCPLKRINFSGADVKYEIADDGSVVVVFSPKDLDGEYMLQAEGRDMSGNPSGAEPYQVSFIVEREPGMIFYPPHPNPSAYGFYFEFAAVGEAAPESFVLTIINRMGQDVAHFTEQNAPTLRVGDNKLQWSGLDAQGSRLSDGLYFYLFTVKISGREYKNSGQLMIVR
jgi:hypothetical protein